MSPNSTQPTVEDTGTAQLVGGVAVVRLDTAFAASIEPSAMYRVFVTPNGDTHGLFVAAKTPTRSSRNRPRPRQQSRRGMLACRRRHNVAELDGDPSIGPSVARAVHGRNALIAIPDDNMSP